MAPADEIHDAADRVEHVDAPPQSLLFEHGDPRSGRQRAARQRGELGSAALIERVGMDGQRLIENLDELEQPSGYFSIILVKEQSE